MAICKVLPNVDIRVIYLAAGHRAGGGTHAHGMDEGTQNIEVVEDTLDFLSVHAGLGRAAGENLPGIGTMYSLGETRLVIIGHEHDLAATIRKINEHYVAFNMEAGLSADEARKWNYGLCFEVHFNAPSKTAEGPMVLHTKSHTSARLGDIAAEELGAAIGLPVRHFLNSWRKWPGGQIGYGFINYTYPMAQIIECDEMHNPARALMIAGPETDDVYGVAVARLLMRLAQVPDQAGPNRRGMHLGWGSSINWPELQATGARGLVTCHAWQLPKTKEAGYPHYWLWRPWFDHGWLRDLDAAQMMARIVSLWEEAGRPYFDAIQIGNEPNLGLENGVGNGSQGSLQNFMEVWPIVAAACKELFPEAALTTTPLSPGPGCRDLEWHNNMVCHAKLADIWNFHCYWDGPDDVLDPHTGPAFRYKEYIDLWWNAGVEVKPVFISECGRKGYGSKGYGEELARYFSLATEPMYIAPYIWDTPMGQWDAWRLQGTNAANVLISTAPVEERYWPLWGDIVPYPETGSSVLRYFRSLVDAGNYPGRALWVGPAIPNGLVAIFEKLVMAWGLEGDREYLLKEGD